MKLRILGALLLSLSATPAALLATTTDRMARLPLQIEVHHHWKHFQVEVARTEAEQERGLMFRDHLDANKGMIFPMAPPHPVAFWMKNTMIPLDIIFIGLDGRIVQMAKRAVPYSLTPMASGGSVKAVLEIGGGAADQLGLKIGDQVSWPQ